MNSRTWKEEQQVKREQNAIDGVFAAVVILVFAVVMLLIMSRPARADEDTFRVAGFELGSEATPHLGPLPVRVEDERKWTGGDTALQALFLVALAADRGQTAHASANPVKFSGRTFTQYQEAGFARHFIGQQPTSGSVNRYFAACAVLHTAVAYALPKPYRTYWQSFWIGVEVTTVDSNVGAGISVRF